MDIKKVVIPAAGLGTRFLPATKSQPKEMYVAMPVITCRADPADKVESSKISSFPPSPSSPASVSTEVLASSSNVDVI